MRAPLTITAAIGAFSRELTGRSGAVVVPIEPLPGAGALECFAVVERAVAQHGGKALIGWRIWEYPGFWLEAEFHAVWRQPDGRLVDVSPAPGPFARTLFVPDSTATYEGRQVNNRFWPLSGHPAVRNFIAAQRREFELMNRGARAWEHGEIRLASDERREYTEILEAKERNLALLEEARAWRVGRNEMCPCGSGRKYRKCCQAAARSE